MSWVENVVCTACRSSFHKWRVIDGTWTCECGQQMTVRQIATYHAALDLAEGSDTRAG